MLFYLDSLFGLINKTNAWSFILDFYAFWFMLKEKQPTLRIVKLAEHQLVCKTILNHLKPANHLKLV